MSAGTQVASLFAVLSLEDKLTPGLDQAGRGMDKFASFSKGAFKTAMIGASIGVGLLGAGLGLAVKEAMEAELNVAKLESVIRSTGGVAGVTSHAAQNLADALSQITRFSDDAILQGETMLLTFTNIGSNVFPRAVKSMLDMAEMFGSMEEASIQLGKALNDPIVGVTALRRIGIQLSEEQEEQIKKFMEVGDVASAQAIILGELEREFGGVAVAAGDTLAGKIDILKNKFLNFAEEVGMAVIPFLLDFTDKALEPAVNKIGGFAEDVANAITAVSKYGITSHQALWPLVQLTHSWDVAERIQKVAGRMGELQKAISEVGGKITGFIGDHEPAFENALLAMGAVLGGAVVYGGILKLGAALALINLPILGLILAVGLLAYAWTEDWLGMKTTLGPILSDMDDDVKLFSGSVLGLAGVLWFLGPAAALAALVMAGLSNNMDGVTGALANMKKEGKEGDLVGYLDAVIDLIFAIPMGIANLFVDTDDLRAWIGIWENLKTILGNLPALWDLFTKALGGFIFPKPVQELVDKITGIQGSGQWIANNLGKILGAIVFPIPAAIVLFHDMLEEMVKWAITLGLIEGSSVKMPPGFGMGGDYEAPPPLQGGTVAPPGAGADLPRGPGGPGGDFVGPYSAGVPVLVGREAQPELFMPNSSGMHYPKGAYSLGGKSRFRDAVYLTLQIDSGVLFDGVVSEGNRRNVRVAVA